MLDRGADALRRVLQQHVSGVGSVQMSGTRNGRGQVACVDGRGREVGSAAENDRVRGDRCQRGVLVEFLEAEQEAGRGRQRNAGFCPHRPQTLTEKPGQGTANGPQQTRDRVLRRASGQVIDDVKQHPGGRRSDEATQPPFGEPAGRGCDEHESVHLHRTIDRAQVCQCCHPAHRVPRQSERTGDLQCGEDVGEIGCKPIDLVGAHGGAVRAAMAAVVVADDSHGVAPMPPQVTDLGCPAVLREAKAVQHNDGVLGRRRRTVVADGQPYAVAGGDGFPDVVDHRVLLCAVDAGKVPATR